MRNLLTAKLVVVSILLALVLVPSPVLGGSSTNISVSGNSRYFVDGDGKPFFWQGDTEWELFHLFSVADAKELLLDRHKQGFTVIQVMVAGVYPEWDASKGMKPWKDQQAWLDNNPLTPNEEYFKRADAIVAAAEENGIIP